MMKVKELKTVAVEEMASERMEEIKSILKGKIDNIKAIKKTLAKLEKDLAKFEKMDIDEVDVHDVRY